LCTEKKKPNLGENTDWQIVCKKLVNALVKIEKIDKNTLICGQNDKFGIGQQLPKIGLAILANLENSI